MSVSLSDALEAEGYTVFLCVGVSQGGTVRIAANAKLRHVGRDTYQTLVDSLTSRLMDIYDTPLDDLDRRMLDDTP